MGSIGTISGVNNLSYLQPASSATPRISGGDSDGASDSRGGAGAVGNANFMSAISQALGKNMTGSATSSSAAPYAPYGTTVNTTQGPQAALQSFVQNLFSSLAQANGTPVSGNQKTGGDSDGDKGGGNAASVAGGSNMTANLQSLLQQLSVGSQAGNAKTSGTTDPLSSLNSSFQNLISSINASQGQIAATQGQAAASPAPTL